MAKYKCVHCNQIVERESNKKWIPSYCDITGKDVRLQRIKEDNEQGGKMKITKNELSSLKKIRNYFGEHDKTPFEHLAYVVIDDLIKKAEKGRMKDGI